MKRRRRFAAGLAALVGFTGALVFGGVTVANADGVIAFGGATPGQGTTSVWSPTAYLLEGITSNTLATDVISVVDYSTNTLGDPIPGCTALDPSAGSWSCPTVLDAGFADIRVFQAANSDVRTFSLDPPAPTIERDPTLVAPFNERVTVTGTVSWTGGSVQASVEGSNAPTCADSDVTDGTWSCELRLDDDAVSGTFTLRVFQQAQGTTSANTEQPFIVGDPPPAVVTITNPADTQVYTWDAGTFAAIDGRAPVGSPVTVEIDGTPIAACTGLTVDPGGNWDCGSRNIPIGQHVVTAIQDADSDTSSIDVRAPAPEVGGQPLSGRSEPGQYVGGTYALDGYAVFATLYDGEVEVASCEDDGPVLGTWWCTLDLTGLAIGPFYSLEVLQRPNPENPAIRSQTSAYPFEVTDPADSLFITSPAGGDEFDWTPDGVTVTGTTPTPGVEITVYFDDEEIACSDPAPTTTWSCDVGAIEPGTYSLIAEQNSVLSNTVDFTVLLPTPDVDESTLSYVEGSESATFQGASTYPGAQVSVVVEIGDSVTLECDDFSETDGWSCQVPIDTLAVGPYTVYVAQSTELATSYQTTYSLEITAPPPPTTPTLTCGFSPDGGFTGEGAQALGYIYLGLITDYGANGSGPDGEFFGDRGSCDGDSGLPFEPWTGFTYQDVDVCSDDSCSASGLAPGDYEVRYAVDDSLAGYDYSAHSYLFRIPPTPVISTVAATTNSVVLSGGGAPGDTVQVVRPAGTSLCTTTVDSSGVWACQFPKSSTSSARVFVTDGQSGGMSAYSAARTIPVFVAPVTPVAPTPVAPTPVAEPAPTVALVNWFLEFGGNLSNLKPGDTFKLNVSGMPEGTAIEVWMYSTPVLIGTATGTGLPMTLDLTVPQDIESGPHEIRMIGVTPLGTKYFFTSEATVIGGVAPAEPVKDGPALSDKPGTAGAVDRTDPAAPSALSEGLAPASAIAANPATIAIAGGLALALLFLVALPTELLNSSLSSNTSRLGRAYGAVDGALTKAQDWFIKVTRSRAIAAAILTTIVAIIYGFVDPGFGFDIVSVRLVLSLAIAFFLLSFVASWISGMIIRRAWGAMGVIAMQPSILLFAIVGVFVARVLDFSPGFLVGIAIGLELLQASRTVSARAVFVQIAVVTGLALAAWGVYSVFTPGDDFAGMLVEDTMVAVTAEGLTGALIALFPLRFLDGHDLWAVSKRLWVLAFLVVATAFALLVLPTAIQGTDIADYGTWLLVFAVFGLGSLAVWLIFVRADRRAADAEQESIDA